MSALQFPGSAGPERFLSRGRPGPPAGLAPFASVSPAALPQKARGAAPAPGGPSPPPGTSGSEFPVTGFRKVPAADGRCTVTARGRFYSSAAFPCCCVCRTVCVSCRTEKYVKA